MKFTVSWLKEHLDTECSSEEILEKLNMIGLEVESYDNPKKLYEDFSVCKVISLEKHPDANKLNKCLLDTKNGHVSVICGANNVKVGMKAVFAPVGTYVTGLDIYLKSTKIRGIQSDGMLVSEKELLKRKSKWLKPKFKFDSGVLYNYIRNVSDASSGCVTD